VMLTLVTVSGVRSMTHMRVISSLWPVLSTLAVVVVDTGTAVIRVGVRLIFIILTPILCVLKTGVLSIPTNGSNSPTTKTPTLLTSGWSKMGGNIILISALMQDMLVTWPPLTVGWSTLALSGEVMVLTWTGWMV